MCRSHLNNRDRTDRASSESDSSPFLREDWVVIKDELASLKIPDSKEAPLTHQFAKYLLTFCELYASNASASKKFAALFTHIGPIDLYELLKDLFIKLSFIMMYVEKLSDAERAKLLHEHGEFLRLCPGVAPNSRLRGFRR